MNKLFWGILLIYSNFALSADGITLQILPAWLGYLMLYLACDELQRESALFQKIRPLCIGFTVYTGALWLMSLFGIAANPSIIGRILSLVYICLSLYTGKRIIDAFTNVEMRRNYDLCVVHLRNVWTLLAITSTASQLLSLFPSLAFGCAMVSFFALIFFLHALHGTRKSWENMLAEQSASF